MTAPPMERAAVARSVRADPACPGTWHSASDRAYRRFGCRCPGAVAAHAAYMARDRARRQARRWYRGGTPMPASIRTIRRAQRALAAAAHERARWRGGEAAVDPLNVAHLLAGYRIGQSRREYMVAMLRLEARDIEREVIAAWLGVTLDRLTYYRRRRRELGEARTQRRLADARWRGARNDLLRLRRGAPS